jgi:hypothetical protein
MAGRDPAISRKRKEVPTGQARGLKAHGTSPATGY